MIQVSAVHGLLQDTAPRGTERSVQLQDGDMYENTVQRSHKEILTAKLRAFASGLILH